MQGHFSGIASRVKFLLDYLEKRGKELGRKIKLLIAVKNRSENQIKEVLKFPEVLIGENRWQQLREHIPLYTSAGAVSKVHFIGTLQSNKIKYLVRELEWIDSVDSKEKLLEIERRAQREGKRVRVMLEVNAGEEPSKSGFLPSEIAEFTPPELQFCEISGIMALPPLDSPPELYSDLKKLYNRMKGRIPTLKYLSLGTTHDFPIAIREGSNMIRIGRGVFEEDAFEESVLGAVAGSD